MTARRLLSIATLYPNRHTPRFGTFVARSLEGLAARDDWDVTVINPIGLPPIRFGGYSRLAASISEGMEHGVEVHRPTFPLIPKLSGPVNPALIARAILPLARKLHAERPFGMVDAQFFYPDGPAAARIARTLGLPLAIKARGADISYWGVKPCARRQMRAAADQARLLLAVSEALAADMGAIGLPRAKTAVHYTGLDRLRFQPRDREESRRIIAERYGIPADGHLIATVGALIPRKGQALVIAALADLPDTHLALVGTGADQAALEAQARQSGLADRVHFMGSLDHDALPILLSAAEAMVLPSESEGLANAWVEALACGCPLVITDAGGARELLHDSSAGLIAQRDSRAIAAATRSVLSAGIAPEAVAQNVAQFSWDAHADKLAEYYTNLLAR
jgi:glycosyltransferase involved in cell wall biosynthesis